MKHSRHPIGSSALARAGCQLAGHVASLQQIVGRQGADVPIGMSKTTASGDREVSFDA